MNENQLALEIYCSNPKVTVCVYEYALVPIGHTHYCDISVYFMTFCVKLKGELLLWFRISI